MAVDSGAWMRACLWLGAVNQNNTSSRVDQSFFALTMPAARCSSFIIAQSSEKRPWSESCWLGSLSTSLHAFRTTHQDEKRYVSA